MPTLFFRKKNGQVAPFMVLVMAVLILAIAATMIIGETGFTRLRLANLADSALISGTSSFCRGLNQIPPLHNRMFLNYLSLQIALLVASPFTNKVQAYVAAVAWTALTAEQNYELLSKAWDIADAIPKELRTSAYDTVFGGALVDEPKPFRDTSTPGHFSDGDPRWEERRKGITDPIDTCLPENLIGWGEVGRDAQGRINFVNYPKYLYRDSHFTCQYRAEKFKNGNWYNNGSLSYFFNKTQKAFEQKPGLLEIPFVPGQADNDPDLADYDSYLAVELSNFPDEVDVYPMPAVLFFYYIIYCPPVGEPCGVAPGFMPLPFAWIAWVHFNSNYGMTAHKRIPFTRIPFFNRSVDLQHSNRVHISGNVWTGYDFSMQ